MTVKQEEEDIPVYDANQVQAEPQAVQSNTNYAPTATAVPVQQPEIKEQQQQQTVDVIAPTNMAEGYQFNVDSGGRMIRVAVPPGGVVAGQRFGAIILNETAGGGMPSASSDPHMIPRGRWRDDLCDCCKFGCCHPQCCLTFWCPSCALGQVMTRNKLNWCGEPIGNQSVGMSAFRILFIITTIYMIISWILGIVVDVNEDEDDDYYNTSTNNNTEDEDVEVSTGSVISDALGFAFFIFICCLTIRTRSYIRGKYEIPTKCCGGCEDCCCSFWCQPCTICQMARHTANFNDYSANCCSETGLNQGAPDIV